MGSWDQIATEAAAIEAALTNLPVDGEVVAERGSTLRQLEQRAQRIVTATGELDAVGLSTLARACGKGIELVRSGALVTEHALPIVIASVHTLHIASTSRTANSTAIEAARFELESLFPQPGRPTRASSLAATPDVPASSLTRRQKPRE